MRLFTACAAAVALLGTAGAASAQDVDIAFNAVATSDYVFRGFSQTGEDPAVQGGFDLTVSNGLYAGVWASNVDFGDSTDAEVDFYSGYRSEAAGFAYDVGLVAYAYVNAPNFADYDYIEFKLAASRAVGPVTVGAAVFYSPDFFGADDEATYGEVNAAFTPIDKLTLSGAVGQQWLDVSDDYVTWNVGGAYTLTDNLVLDVRYHDTDIKGVEIAEDRFVGTIKVLF